MTKRKTSTAHVEPEAPHLQTEFKPKTRGQAAYLRTIIENDVIFASGPAGSGKSYLALGLAAQYYLDGKCDTIVLARPTIEASPRGLGYLKGDLNEKLSPFLAPAVEHLKRFLSKNVFFELVKNGGIRYEALEYMRGKTFDKSFMILDEAQNCTKEQLSMFVTRMGEKTKVVCNGDIEQVDIRNRESTSDFEFMCNKIARANSDYFSFIELTDDDIVRNKLIREFLKIVR